MTTSRMLTRRDFRIIVAISIATFSNVSMAADDNVEIMKKLYSKIAGVVGIGSNDPVLGSDFLVLTNPGIPLDPNINTSTAQGLYSLVRTVDKVLLPSFVYQPTNDRIYSLYKDILNYRELPIIKPTDEETKNYKRAHGKIFTNSSNSVYTTGYENFREKQLVLAQAQDKIKTFQNGNPYADVPNLYYAQLDQAQKDFDLIGNADELIAAYEIVKAYGRLDPNVWWGELRQNFQKATRQFSGQDFGVYNFYPAYPVWLDASRTWTSLTLSDQDIEETKKSSHTNVGGGFSAGWGMWSIGAAGSESEDRTSFKLNSKTYKVSLEIARVDIDRPWMESSVFASNAWRWVRSSPRQQQISDGGNAIAGIAPLGIMPFLPVGLLLARNASLTGDWTDKFEETIKKQSSGGGRVGWGPISFGVSKSSSSSEEYKKYKLTDNTISFSSPQIIGVFVQVLGRSPDPDLVNYKWPVTRPSLDEEIAERIAEKNRLSARTRQIFVEKNFLEGRLQLKTNQPDQPSKRK